MIIFQSVIGFFALPYLVILSDLMGVDDVDLPPEVIPVAVTSFIIQLIIVSAYVFTKY